MRGYHDYQDCIEACLRCAAICNYCASACTREEDVKMMAKCIRLDMECAAICHAAAKVMSLGSSRSQDLCRICVEICEECGNECSLHEHEHCRECAKICHQCAEECRRVMNMAA